MNKICIVSSRGGHLFQLMQLKSWWGNHDRFWITFKGKDTGSLLKGEKKYYAYAPESRNIITAVLNFFLGIKLLKLQKPNLVISAGAGVAPPIIYAAKFLGIKTIYIEPYDFIHHPTLSGKLVYPVVDTFLVQHKCQLKFYPKAKYWGATL